MKNLRNEIKDFSAHLNEGFVTQQDMIVTIGYKYVTMFDIERAKKTKMSLQEFKDLYMTGEEEEDWSMLDYLAV